MRAIVIPEGVRHDHLILGPIFEAIWDEIRNERDAKEAYFDPIARDRRLFHLTGPGRKELGLEAARNSAKVRRNCPEIRDLEGRIRRWIEAAAQR